MRKFFIFILVIVALITGIILYNKVLHPKYRTSDKGSSKNKVVQVNGLVVQPTRLENSILASGTLIASEDVNLCSQVSGTIISLDVKEGTRVSKGTLIVKLFDDDLKAQIKKLEAQKESAERTEQRLKALLAIKGVGEQDYDNALTQLKGTLADIDNIKAQIEKTEIRAPFTGVIGLKNVSAGAYLTPVTVVASLQQIDPLKLDFTIPEKYAAEIKKGDPVQFTVAGFSKSFTAKVFAIEPQIDQDTRTIKVRAMVGNTESKLFPGAFAKIELALKSIDNALMVPTQCVVPDTRSNRVVVAKNGIAEFRTVTTGIRNDSLIQIADGIEPGDTVITTALLFVKAGMSLKVQVGR
jgi:membrane fusion protein (multidrug efflux system)